ncbi:hypothetical protein [Nocardiopsis coralliicola]
MPALRPAPVVGPPVQRRLTVVHYTGRRSGPAFSTPVAFQRTGPTVVIRVAMPERKRWWRNFTGAGGPLTLELDGRRRTGHAVAISDNGQTSVTVHLDPESGAGSGGADQS